MTEVDVRLRDGTPADRDAIHRMWLESDWLDDDDDDAKRLTTFHDLVTWSVGELDDGRAEASASRLDGTIRHDQQVLPFCAITSVNVGRVARGQGLAGGVTALATARGADDGAAVAGLGMFDQGFYDRVGFGNVSPWVTQRFDPANLVAPWGHRPPLRLTAEDDAERIHRAIVRRRTVHGQVVLDHVDRTRVEIGWTPKGAGLGYADADGELTHLLWMSAKDEHGPYRVELPVFQDGAQLRELLSLLHSLSGQVRYVVLEQPVDLSLQELLRHPHRHRPGATGTASRDVHTTASTWHQARMLDLPACFAVVSSTSDLRFVADVRDPLAAVLDRAGDAVVDQPRWRGVGGRWLVTLGASTGARRLGDGEAPDLPVLSCDVNHLTRLWLGVRPASHLAMVEQVAAPPALLEALDDVFRLPVPHFDCEF